MAGPLDESDLFHHLQDDLSADQFNKLKELKGQLKEVIFLKWIMFYFTPRYPVYILNIVYIALLHMLSYHMLAAVVLLLRASASGPEPWLPAVLATVLSVVQIMCKTVFVGLCIETLYFTTKTRVALLLYTLIKITDSQCSHVHT